MNWQNRLNLAVGDPVRYSREWLAENKPRSELREAKGVITGISEEDGRTLATVEWDRPDVPDLVNVLNLVRVRERRR